MMESRGFQYDGAEASFELLVRRTQPGYSAPFELEDFMIVERRRHKRDRGEDENEMLAEAMAKVRVGEHALHTAAEGNGPVNALDGAVRKALSSSTQVGRDSAASTTRCASSTARPGRARAPRADGIHRRRRALAHGRLLDRCDRSKLAGPGRQSRILADAQCPCPGDPAGCALLARLTVCSL